MKNIKRNTIVYGIITLIVYLLLFFLIDKSIITYVYDNFDGTATTVISEYISLGATNSFYKLGLMASFILIIVLQYKKPCPQWANYLLYICLSISIAIIIGDGFKYLLGRYRPIMLFNEISYGLSFIGTSWELNSTPSGHTLRAFSFAFALSMVFKRYRYIFISIAILIGVSRVLVTDHYPSDVVFGAYIGIFTALWTYKLFFRPDIKISEN